MRHKKTDVYRVQLTIEKGRFVRFEFSLEAAIEFAEDQLKDTTGDGKIHRTRVGDGDCHDWINFFNWNEQARYSDTKPSGVLVASWVNGERIVSE